MSRPERRIPTPRPRVRTALLALTAGAGVMGTDPAPATGQQAALMVIDSVAHLEALAREPMVIEHPDGTLFVSGYEAGMEPLAVPNLWRSEDSGTSWQRLDVGTVDDGAAGNSCVDLAVAPDGTVYFLTMGYDRTASEGTHIAMGVSRDRGDTWSWTTLSRHRFDDRPWVEVAPDGTAHVIWNDGSGVSHTMSTDGGRTWTAAQRIHDLGGSSHLAVGPDGEVAVRIAPTSASGNRMDPAADFIAVSTDGGRTWTKRPPPVALDWSDEAIPRWVEPLAWDSRGRLYHLWSEGRDLWLGRSTDLGESWDRWPIAEDRDVATYPYLVADGDGELAATWYTGTGDELRAHAARISMGRLGGAAPAIAASPPITVNAWTPESSSTRDTGGEYLPVTFLRDGDLGVVTTVQNLATGELGFVWWRLGSGKRSSSGSRAEGR